MPRKQKTKHSGRRSRSGGATKVRIELPGYADLVAAMSALTPHLRALTDFVGGTDANRLVPKLLEELRELNRRAASLERQVDNATLRLAAMRRSP